MNPVLDGLLRALCLILPLGFEPPESKLRPAQHRSLSA